MTERKDEALELFEDAPELIDLGDAVDETKQVTHHGIWPDCYFGIGAKYGCS